MALSPTQAANTPLPNFGLPADASSEQVLKNNARTNIATKLIKQGLIPGTSEFTKAYRDALTEEPEEPRVTYRGGKTTLDTRLAKTLLAGGMDDPILKMFIAAAG